MLEEGSPIKSIYVRLAVFLIGLIIFSHSSAWGADWKFFSVAKSNELVGDLPLYRFLYFYDASSVVYLSQSILRVWIKSFEVERGKSDTFPSEIKDLDCETLGSSKLDYVTHLLEIDCQERRYKPLKVFFFVGEDGVEKEAPIGAFPSLYKAKEIPPGDDLDILFKMLCK